ncbi:MAG TPA: hypothetical protein VMX15_06515 [Candidatus Heimdallarchaeota archaeon]|nr:hypothetical protein [Candidatus Heimdallarchaeota archaeon]
MSEYDFRCLRCGKVSTHQLSPSAADDLQHQRCECGAVADRIYGQVQVGYIDWVNPDRGDGINMGLPIKRDSRGRPVGFKSAREREDWAKAHGLEKLER